MKRRRKQRQKQKKKLFSQQRYAQSYSTFTHVSQEAAKEAEIKSQRVLVQFISDWKTFAEAIEGVVPTACQLLGSTNISDVTSGVEFFVTMTEFGVDNAIVGVRKMLALMWAKETAAKDCAIEAYKKLYLNPDPALHPTAKASVSNTKTADANDLSGTGSCHCKEPHFSHTWRESRRPHLPGRTGTVVRFCTH